MKLLNATDAGGGRFSGVFDPRIPEILFLAARFTTTVAGIAENFLPRFRVLVKISTFLVGVRGDPPIRTPLIYRNDNCQSRAIRLRASQPYHCSVSDQSIGGKPDSPIEEFLIRRSAENPIAQ